MKIYVLQTMHPESGFQIAPNWSSIEKIEMTSQFFDMTWRHRHFFFWCCFVSLVKFSYWYKFHVNIITVSGVLTISFYKGLTRNPEIGNNPAWVLNAKLRLPPTQIRVKRANINLKVADICILLLTIWVGDFKCFATFIIQLLVCSADADVTLLFI